MSNKISPILINEIQQMNLNEQLELMLYLATMIKNNQDLNKQKKFSLANIIGRGKGCFKNPQAVDQFISEERDKWVD